MQILQENSQLKLEILEQSQQFNPANKKIMNILTLSHCNFTNLENLTLLHLERVKLLKIF